jgi:hypothetical protein
MTVRKPDTNDAIPIFAIFVNNKGVLQCEKYQTDKKFIDAHRGGRGGGAPQVPPQRTLKNCNIKMQ